MNKEVELRKLGKKVFEEENINRIIEILDEAVEKDIITDYFFTDDSDLFVLTNKKAYIITADYNKQYDTTIINVFEIPVKQYFEIKKLYVPE